MKYNEKQIYWFCKFPLTLDKDPPLQLSKLFELSYSLLLYVPVTTDLAYMATPITFHSFMVKVAHVTNTIHDNNSRLELAQVYVCCFWSSPDLTT